MACQELVEACLEKLKANLEKTKVSLKEIEAVVETGLGEMNARMDVFEEKLDKIVAAEKACLGKTEANMDTGQKLREAKSKTDLEEMDTTDLKASQETSEAVAVYQEVCNVEVAVETVGAPEDQSMDQEPAVRYHNPRKRWNKDDDV
jgi:hypothetical protein